MSAGGAGRWRGAPGASRGSPAAESPAGRTVVLGVGSPLLGDDGLGLRVLDALRSGWDFRPEVDLVDGGTWGMRLLHHVEAADRLLILDAIRIGAPPGELVVLEQEELPRLLGTKLSPHQIDLREMLALAELRGTLPQEAVAIGLEPARVESGTELSPELGERLEDVVRAALHRLSLWGHRAVQRVGPLPHRRDGPPPDRQNGVRPLRGLRCTS